MDTMESRKKVEELFDQARLIQTGGDFQALARFLHKFPYLSPFNAALVRVQRPGARYVANITQWNKKFHRTLRPGAQPLVILVPFGPVGFVFELEDTQGKPIPEAAMKELYPFGTNQVLEEGQLDRMIHCLLGEGIICRTRRLGSQYAGCIGRIQEETVLYRKTSKQKTYVKCSHDIVLNSAQTPTEQFGTLAHELGHFFCGHTNPKHRIDYLPDRSWLLTNTKEFEAEAVCYLVCDRLGIQMPSAEYLHGYLEEDNKLPKDISIDTILRAAGTIEDLYKGVRKPRKKLLVVEKIE